MNPWNLLSQINARCRIAHGLVRRVWGGGEGLEPPEHFGNRSDLKSRSSQQPYFAGGCEGSDEEAGLAPSAEPRVRCAGEFTAARAASRWLFPPASLPFPNLKAFSSRCRSFPSQLPRGVFCRRLGQGKTLALERNSG